MVIEALSSAELKYPGDRIVTVWLPDASVKYFRGKHIAVFIVAAVILLFGVVYTSILFLWQWLLSFSERKYLRWIINNQKLSMFIETYNAPYIPQNRYWTGLLLIARIFLYVASAANVSENPKINLLTLGSVIGSIVFFKEVITIKRKVYKKWPIEILEYTCYINLVFLCIFSFYTLQNETAKVLIADISVSITFLLFLGVLIYHVSTKLIIKLWKRCCGLPCSEMPVSENNIMLSDTVNTISISTVEMESTKMISTAHSHDELREPLIEENERVQ